MLVVIRGGGDLGSGVAHRLYAAGYDVAILEIEQPLVIRRAVAFATAVFDGSVTVEGVGAMCVTDVAQARATLAGRVIPVLVDRQGMTLAALQPAALVDARLAKRKLDTRMSDAPLVIALGPGFVAGRDAHAVIETQRGHDLGRVIWQGEAAPDSGVPGAVGGEAITRLLRAPSAGAFRSVRQIGDQVAAGETVGYVSDSAVICAINGVLRGIIHDGVNVPAGLKIGDVDPRGMVEHCFTISDKARAIGGGVLEALLHLRVLPWHQ